MRRQYSSLEYGRMKSNQLSSKLTSMLDEKQTQTQTPVSSSSSSSFSPSPILEPYTIQTQTTTTTTTVPEVMAAPLRMGISVPTTTTTPVVPTTPASSASTAISVKCIMGRSTVYQPLPNLKSNYSITCTGFARAMRNHIWGEHVFMFEKIPENEEDWSKWAACADTHATADEWLEVILPGFELNGVAWFIVRGIDPDSGSLQFYFCPRNDPRGNPILGEFGSMPRFDASQVSIVDGKV